MARYRGPRLRIIRRLGDLPGLTQKVCTRNYPAGQHGPKKKIGGNQKSKESQYAIRLKEKQKLRFNYGINERQLIKYVREARRQNGSTGEILLQLLEMRLDTIVFRLGFASTIAAARQLINHGHICVNSKRVSIASYICTPQDTISVRDTARTFVKEKMEQKLQRSGQPVLPPHLDANTEKCEGTVKEIIHREHVSVAINELLVVEYYSRKV
jgi:small subunit ribosomal protein S4